MIGAASTKLPARPRPFRILRRDMFSTLIAFSKPRSLFELVMMFMSHPRRREMDGVFDALVATATADITRHRLANLIMRWLGIVDQQSGGLHDLACLAKSALRNVDLPPSLLHRMVAIRMQAFDGGHLAIGHVGHRRDAGAHCIIVDDHGACPAQRLATADHGAGQTGFVAKKPE